MTGIPGESIWLTYRLPIAHATIGLLLLVVAGMIVRRVRRSLENERRARQREESLR